MKDKLKSMGIIINNEKLLTEALTHSSYSNEHKTSNYERLEFLGDAVLELITSEYFFLNEDYDEGRMSKIRASYVCEEALDEYGKKINLKKYIRVGHGQINNINATIVADVFEALLAVIYLENNYEIARKFVLKLMVPYIEKGITFNQDYKSILQELVQTDKKSLEYIIKSETGPAHNKKYEIELIIDDTVYGCGIGKSKKQAEQAAAKDAYEKCIRR